MSEVVQFPTVTRVHTQTSVHEIDWAARTVTRMVRADGPIDETYPTATLRRDGDPVPLITLEEPVVGQPLMMVLDVRGDGVATVRTTTPVAAIEHQPDSVGQIEPGAS